MPFGLDDDAQKAYEVLVPGVPMWLREPLVAWLSGRLAKGEGEGWFDTARLVRIQNVLRLDLGAVSGNSITSGAWMRSVLRGLPEIDLLRIVDYIVSESSTGSRAAISLASLEGVLSQARSAYTVGKRSGKLGLVDRVPEGVRVAAEDVTTVPDAGPLLARAWAHIHGLEKNATAAYADAVRAVEAVAIPIVLGVNPDATLGTVIARMRDQGDWRLPLREHDHAPSAAMLVQMLRTLWRGHRDRHGAVDYSDVTAEEARAGVSLAVTLVDWFASGAIARRPDEPGK